MKLSNITGERVFDVLAEIIEPISNIAESEAVTALLKRESLPEGVSAKKFLGDRLKKNLPALLRNNKSDIIHILAAIEGTSPEDYSGVLNFVKLIKDATDLIADNAFIELFTSAQSVTGGAASGSAQENIKAAEA